MLDPLCKIWNKKAWILIVYILHRISSTELTATIMSRSGTARANISALILYLDTEQDRDRYASITHCLGEFSQLVKPFPFLSLDVGDVLLTLNQIDVRNTPPAAIKTMIRGFPNNLHKPSSEKPKLLVITYVMAHDKLDKHISDQVVSNRWANFSRSIISYYNYCFLPTASYRHSLPGPLHQVYTSSTGILDRKTNIQISWPLPRHEMRNSRCKLARPEQQRRNYDDCWLFIFFPELPILWCFTR